MAANFCPIEEAFYRLPNKDQPSTFQVRHIQNRFLFLVLLMTIKMRLDWVERKKKKKGDWDKSSDFIRACSGGDRQIKVNYLGDMKDTELAHDLVGPLSTRAECLALYKISSQIYRAK